MILPENSIGKNIINHPFVWSSEIASAVFDLFPYPIGIVADDTSLIYVNKALLRAFGYNENSDVSDDIFLTYSNPNDRLEISKILKEKGEVVNFQTSFVRKNGDEYKTFLNAKSVRIGEKDHILLMILVGSDDVKMAWEDLRIKDQEISAIYKNSSDAIMRLAPPDWKFTGGNDTAFKMFNIADESEFTSIGPWNLSPQYQPDGKLFSEKAKEMIEKAVHDGSNIFEWTHKKYNGEDFSAMVFLTRINRGKDVSLQAVVRDISAEKKAEQEKSFRILLLKTVLESSMDGILVVDENSKVVSCNHNFTQIWSIPEDVLATKSDELLLNYVSEKLENPDEFRVKVKELYENKAKKSRDDISLKDGRIFERYSSPLIDENNKYLGRVWYFRDVTKERGKLYSLLNFAESTKKKLSAYTPLSVIEASNIETSKDTFDSTVVAIDNIISYHNLEDSRTEAMRKAMVSILSDLSLEKKNLEESKNKIEAIITSIADGIFVVNKAGEVIFFNPAAENLTGWSKSEVLGKHFSETMYFCSDEHSERNSFIKLTLENGLTEKLGFHASLRKKDGVIIPISDSISPIKNLEGKMQGAVIVFSDATAERKIDSAKSEFVMLASHQLRTPISTSAWFLEMLLSGEVGELNEKQKDYAQELFHSNRRMWSIVSMLLNISRIEMGTFIISPEIYEIKNVIDEILSSYRLSFEKKNLSYEVTVEENLPSINIDKKLFNIVMDNLLSNSLDYTPENGKIIVSVKKDDQNLIIDVTDNGIGIPKKDQSKIFTKLFRSDNAKEIDSDGTGIGLNMTKSVVESWNGKLGFTSPVTMRKDEKGKEYPVGTSFFFSIPLSGMIKKEGSVELLSQK